MRTPTAMRPALLRTVIRSRALHFLVLGGALFALSPRRADPSTVSLSTRDLATLHAAQASRLGVPILSPKQIDEVDQRAIEDEVLYREALRLGLDRGDNVVRAHLVQKMLLLAEDMAGATRTPTEADLRAYYDSTRERWTRGESVHFIHVFAAHHDAMTALLAEARRANGVAPPMLGDAFPSSRDVTSGRTGLAAVYGEPFAAAVFAQPTDAWGEPVESKFGWHLVKVLGRDGGRPATFDEVRDALALEWAVDFRHRAIASFLAKAFDRYKVTVDGASARRMKPGDRLARRLDPSAED